MPKDIIYLDYASTTPLDKEVFNAYISLLETNYYNAESIYQGGVSLNNLQNKSRSLIADMFHVKANEVIFTSGASEANSLLLKGYAIKHYQKQKLTYITSNVEHSSIANTMKQLEQYYDVKVIYVPVLDNGSIDYDYLESVINHDVNIVSIMAVNNETGAINDIKKVAKIVRSKSHAFLHTDITQALGKIDLDFLDDVDALSFSAHKIHGLKYSGALIKKNNIDIEPIISGGSQQFSLRGGTDNAIGNIVLAKSCRLAMQNQEKAYQHNKELFNYCVNYFKDDKRFVIQSPLNGSMSVFNVSVLPVDSQVMLNALDKVGVYVSAHSTCESSLNYSLILKAMGKSDLQAKTALRLSFDISTTIEQLQIALDYIKEFSEKYATR